MGSLGSELVHTVPTRLKSPTHHAINTNHHPALTVLKIIRLTITRIVIRQDRAMVSWGMRFGGLYVLVKI